MGRGKDRILTALQMKFVEAYETTATAAARKIGCRNPKQSGSALMKIARVRAAIEKKQEERRQESVRVFISAVARNDVVAGIMLEIKKLSDWRDTLLAKEKLTAAEQNILVKVQEAITDAYHEVGDLQGFYVSKSVNYDRMLDDLTEEELRELVFNGNPPKMGGQSSHGSQRPSGNPTKSS